MKSAIRAHWEAESCGTRGVSPDDRRRFFHQIEWERYIFEPYLRSFAGFEQGRGKRILEVGVGTGTDFVNWLRAGSTAVGIDLTWSGVQLTRERMNLERLSGVLLQADAESLPFRDETFDIVFAYGVLHHSPDTSRAIAEVHRVLKSSGTARVMIYHVPSVVGLLLWLVHCVGKLQPWRSARWAIAQFLESPGTKAYSVPEARTLFRSFSTVSLSTRVGAGDLLQIRRSRRYQGWPYLLLWKLYPRWLVRMVGDGVGLGLLVEAKK